MFAETTPRHSAKWRPTHTFAQETGKATGETRHLEDGEKKAYAGSEERV